MNVVLALVIGFAIAYYLQEKRITRLKSYVSRLEEQIEAQREAFESLIYEFNHKTAISPASSVQGMIGLIIYATQRCVKSLRELYGNQDWNTLEIITELDGITQVELPMSYRATVEWLKTIRTVLEKFGPFQFTKDSMEQNNKEGV